MASLKLSVFYFTLLTLLSVAVAQNSYTCNVPNCQICTSVNFCGLCNNGFILSIPLTTGNPVCEAVVCVISNCVTCLISNQCEYCSSGYQVTSTGQCQQIQPINLCSIPNCLTCSSSNSSSCIRCASGFGVQDGICLSTYLLPQGCQIAQYPFVCQLCTANLAVQPGYSCSSYLNITCPQNCLSCNPSNCIQCASGYYLQYNVGCFQCTVPNCQMCSTSSVCTQCNPGFGLTTTSTCQPITYGCTIPNCQYCSNSMSGSVTCLQCQSGFVYFQQSSACVA